MSDALWGAIIGGLLTALGTFVVSIALDRRSRAQWLRQRQIDAAAEVLAALQNLNRKMIDVARMVPAEANEEGGAWEEHHAAAIRWNAARYQAALVSPKTQIERLNEIDSELDRLLDLAIVRRWRAREFRSERQVLGRLAAEYLLDVRRITGLHPVDLRSIWPWALDDSSASRGLQPVPGRRATQPRV